MSAAGLSSARPIRVMIVDDSAVIRTAISTILKTDPAIHVVGFASNGQQAVDNVLLYKPDIMILDIEMPFMDGITALPLLLEKKPDLKVLICSTLSARGAEVSIKALSLGATECLLKPDGASAIDARRDFHANLLRVVRSIGAANNADKPAGAVALRKAPLMVGLPKILAIGSSTGGPNALISLLPHLKGLNVPIVITQHMPKTFTALLANHINQASGIPCVEGQDNMIVQSGCAYVAPGGYHMTFEKDGEQLRIKILDSAPENFCKPSVDPMLRSLVSIYGDKILTVILTGMGNDGFPACQQVVAAGGQVIAQDAATSVVWGMPGAVASAGLCSLVAPVHELAGYITKTFGTRSAGSSAAR